jgi:acetyl-CoA acetyltransferase
VTDGAGAFVMTSAERAKDAPKPPALIRAVAQGSLAAPQPGIQFPVLFRESITTLPAKPVADTLYRRAGLGPADIDVAQFYDCFTITVLLQIEDFGFAPRARAAARIERRDRTRWTATDQHGGGHSLGGYIHRG